MNLAGTNRKQYYLCNHIFLSLWKCQSSTRANFLKVCDYVFYATVVLYEALFKADFNINMQYNVFFQWEPMVFGPSV